MIIMGFDLSLSDSGWAAIRVNDDDSYALIDSGHIPTIKRKGKITYTTGKRLSIITKEIERVIDTFKPDLIAKEASFSNGNNKSTQQIFKVNGVFELTVYRSDVQTFTEYAPTTIKKEITGSGRADKAHVAKIVNVLTGSETTNANITDAIAVAITCAAKKRLIKLPIAF